MPDRRSPEPISAAVVRDLAETPNLAIIIDLDGTLLPISATPPMSVDASAKALLHDLARLPGVQVVIVSGRTRASLSALLPGDDLWLVAEHGAWRRGREGSFVTAIEGSPGPLRACVEALEHIAQRYQGAWVEPKSWAVTLHYRLVPDDLLTRLHREVDSAVLQCLVSAPDYERLNGSATVEVRHRGAHKGTAIDWVLEEVGGAARLVVIGDDVTDEDAFRAAGPDDVTIHVGAMETIARHRLAGPEGVRDFLASFIEERASSAPGSASWPPPMGETAQAAKLVVLSNRLPEPLVGDGRRQNVGGLVSALAPALEERGGGLWIGWSGRAKKGVPIGGSALHFDHSLHPQRATLDFAPETVAKFYDGFCNRTLWPLLHGFFSKVRYDDDEWHAYVAVNEAFADATLRVAPRDVPVWVHDYHLLLAGRALRRAGHIGPIGFFLHVPLPALELMETLPWSHEILDAMMDYDLVGFHTHRYVSNYVAAQATLSGAEDFMGCLRKGDRTSRVGVFPIGIAPEPFLQAGTYALDDEIANLIRGLRDRRLVLGVDRLDYSKGIPERLLAFHRFLESFPEWRRKVSFVQLSVPSREGLPEYAEQRKLTEELVGRINGEFGDADWVPVRYLYRSYRQSQLARLYRAADVAVVTPLRDGMNLVAKEFVASQDSAKPGVLLLSKFAGAAEQLVDAVLTNPFHARGVARDLDRCLRMPLEERRARHARLLDLVTTQTAQVWGSSFIAALEVVRNYAPDGVECPGHAAA